MSDLNGLQSNTSPDQEYKNCPYCAERILAAAVLCRYCGKELNTPLPITKRRGPQIGLVLIVLVSVLALAGAALGIIRYVAPLRLEANLNEVAMHFVEGSAATDEMASDGIFEQWEFYELWCMYKSDCAYELQDTIVRDSAAGEKQVTLSIDRTFTPMTPPVDSEGYEDYAAPIEQWNVAGESQHDAWSVFFIFERLDGRWVIRCAETDMKSEYTASVFPDLCEGK